MKVFNKNQSIRLSLKLQLFIIFSVLIVGVAFSSKQIFREIEAPYLMGLINLESERTAELVAQASLEALISEDIPHLQSIVEQIGQKNSHILFIQIYSADNRKLVEWKQKNIFENIEYIKWEKEVILEGERFGHVFLRWRTDVVDRQVDRHVEYLSYLFIAMVVIVGLINLLLTHIFVVKPIQIINNNLYKVNENSLLLGLAKDDIKIKTISKYCSTELVNLSDSVITQLHLWIENRVRERALLEEVALRKNAEKKLELHRDSLQQQVDEKTKDLRDAVKIADTANQSKSVFLANMSHELRTPMHGIISFSSLGKKRVETLSTEKHLRYYSNIKTSADRLLVLINDLLDMAKLESGKMEMNFRASTLLTIAQSCVAEQQARLDEGNQKIVYISADVLGEGLFDEVRIGQVITNFLSNAIKFTQENGIIDFEIRQSSTFLVKQNEQVPALFFSVRDYGIGIPDGECDLVFDKFVQSSDTNPVKIKGTGLGLAICKEIIELHSGRIWAENHPDGGAIFSFMIPVKKTHSE